MYAKCGRINDARRTFDKMNKRDEVSWNAMICGYSMHGMSMEALSTFDVMEYTDCRPYKLTFVGVLSVCNNTGLLDRGQTHFESISRDYNIKPVQNIILA